MLKRVFLKTVPTLILVAITSLAFIYYKVSTYTPIIFCLQIIAYILLFLYYYKKENQG